MSGVSRVGLDYAGGMIQSGSNSTVRVNGAPIAVLGSPVQGHGDSPHNRPTMKTSSGTVRASGIGVCRAGDMASCGHAASGSGDVRAGG